MSDLLQTAQRDYIRISEAANCHYRIAAKILGIEERSRPGVTDMPLRVGSALEPVVNQFMLEQGMGLMFIGDPLPDGSVQQLNPAVPDPFRRGHTDGICFIADPSTLTEWWKHNIPASAQKEMLFGNPMLWEVKTANGTSWNQFRKRGLEGTIFLEHYITQINNYLWAMAHPENDELWWDDDPTPGSGGIGANQLRDFLKAYSMPRPTKALVCFLNTDTKRYAFQVRHLDEERFAKESLALEPVTEALHQGYMPEPTKDGTDPECFMCPFSYICPKVQERVAAAQDINLIDIRIPDVIQMQEAEELTDEYVELGLEMAVCKARRDEIKEKLGILLDDYDNHLITGTYKIKVSPVKGRERPDMEAITALYNELGLEVPKIRGEGHTRLRIDPIYGPSYKDED